MRRITQKEYIFRFNERHNNFYEYLDFPEKYNQKTNIKIICPKHGLFEQRIINHSMEWVAQNVELKKDLKLNN